MEFTQMRQRWFIFARFARCVTAFNVRHEPVARARVLPVSRFGKAVLDSNDRVTLWRILPGVSKPKRTCLFSIIWKLSVKVVKFVERAVRCCWFRFVGKNYRQFAEYESVRCLLRIGLSRRIGLVVILHVWRFIGICMVNCRVLSLCCVYRMSNIFIMKKSRECYVNYLCIDKSSL